MTVGAVVFAVFVWTLLGVLVAVFLYEVAITLQSLLRWRTPP